VPAFLRATTRLLLIGIVVTLLFVFKQWAYVTTYRLYLDHRVDDAAASTATQRFDVDGTRVVPTIVMHDDRVSFHAAIGRESTILATVIPAGRASYEIRVRQNGVDRVAAQGDVTAKTSVACALPAGDGTIVVASRGQLTWLDLRLRRDLQINHALWILAVLIGGAVFSIRASRRLRAPIAVSGRATRWSRAGLAMAAVIGSVAIAGLLVEVALRLVGIRLSSGISAARHDLGELTEDPRWQPSLRYGRRISANVNAINEWQYGDIVRMGFISPAVSEGRVHRYRLRTDAEGFRNPATRAHIEIAALGDSFTDALTMPVEASWPAQLERILDVPVQNYGTAGFGPQQERLVLEDYAVRHRPRVVVLAFFAGNDIRDAEIFERFQQSGGAVDPPRIGWPLKDVVTRADTWYVVNAMRAAASVMYPTAAATGRPLIDHQPGVWSDASGFDRGMFTVPVKGSVLRWAFLPPYLNLLSFSEEKLAARRGWALTRQSLIAMQRASRDVNAEFVLMFLPFKAQVYLPLLQSTFSRGDLAKAFQFSLGYTVTVDDVDAMARNRLAHNALLRRFCEEAGIPFLDVTEVLRERVDAGENMYFPDDSHLNEAGSAVVAERLAEFLEDRSKR
jgi:lysophospholipase L1-like esterase